MRLNPQYDYDGGPDGPLAPLHARSATPDYPCMISVPHGWVPLVLHLNDDLESILPDYTIAQVKEKFAGLRYYINTFAVDRLDPRIAMANEMIAEAERLSAQTCQVCGEQGQQRSTPTGSISTLCDEHAG